MKFLLKAMVVTVAVSVFTGCKKEEATPAPKAVVRTIADTGGEEPPVPPPPRTPR